MEKKKINMLDYFKGQKTTAVLLILIVLGLLLLLTPLTSGKAENKNNNSEDRLKEYGEELERKISELCGEVAGVSNVNVTVYFDTGFELVYAYDEESKETSSGYNTEKKYVTIGSGNDESMVCILERMPNICGIAIVCRGGGNAMVASELVNLISSAYGVPKNKIYVAEGKK